VQKLVEALNQVLKNQEVKEIGVTVISFIIDVSNLNLSPLPYLLHYLIYNKNSLWWMLQQMVLVLLYHQLFGLQ
jgi:hypothetical protein